MPNRLYDTQTVTAGEWNDLTFTFPASNAEGTETDTNYNQLVIKTDVGNTVYVDEIVMAGAEVHVEPENTTPSAVEVISVVDNMGTSGTGNGVVVTDMVLRLPLRPIHGAQRHLFLRRCSCWLL